MELTRVERLSVRANVDLGAIDLRGRIELCEIALLGAQDPEKLSGEFVWKPHGSGEEHVARVGIMHSTRARCLALGRVPGHGP